jgi:hypothetical protein
MLSVVKDLQSCDTAQLFTQLPIFQRNIFQGTLEMEVIACKTTCHKPKEQILKNVKTVQNIEQ